MPSFETSVDWECYCTCGNGICSNVDTRNSRNRSMPQAVVDPCEKCLEKSYEAGEGAGSMSRNEEIARLEERIAELEDELTSLQKETAS